METTTLRSERGQFAKGCSGNPAGRPKGSRNRAALLAEALLEGEAEALVRKLIEEALAGDRSLLKFCVQQILGKPRAPAIELDLAPGQESDPLAVLTAAIRAMAGGEINPAEAASVAKVASTLSRVRSAEATSRQKESAPARSWGDGASAPVFRLKTAAAASIGPRPLPPLYPVPTRRAALLASISPLALRDMAGTAAELAAPVSDLYRLAA
jgi:hypothetical protein